MAALSCIFLLYFKNLRSQPTSQNIIENDPIDDDKNLNVITQPTLPSNNVNIVHLTPLPSTINNNKNIDFNPLPDTLRYTSREFSKEELHYGKYSTQVLDNERESIERQSQIMANHVKNAMKHFWKGYEKCAFGYDELKPITCNGINNWGGLGMTIVDSLDTLYLMDLKDELIKAERWLMDNLNFNLVHQELQVFEITIRVLGGLLSMYSLTKNMFYKSKATEMADILMLGIQGNLPQRSVYLSRRTFSGGMTINLAEVGTFQLEYNYLTKITGNPIYKQKADFVQQFLISYLKNGLIQYDSIKCPRSAGAEADSAYEYILKCWIQTGKTDSLLRDTFDKNKLAFKMLLSKRSQSGILTVGQDGYPEMEHLTCFLPGLIALDAYHNNNKTLYNEDIEFAKSLAYTCYLMYMNQTLHLSPEIIRIFNDKMNVANSGYVQRPETIESFYILHEITGDPIFVYIFMLILYLIRKWGWDIFLAIEKYTKVENGYSGLTDANKERSYSNKAESFFPAETLKYLYLLFDTHHKIDLSKYVFNTEAHPLEI